jgi:hypothetical protein
VPPFSRTRNRSSPSRRKSTSPAQGTGAKPTSRTGGKRRWRGVRLYTIGHSTRTLDALVALLRASGVTLVADIRTIPRSRHNPQFNADALLPALRRRRLRYVHLPALGGLRRARKDSPNTAWRNASFRGYADYMLTEEFERGLAELEALAAEETVAVMCAEAVPWRCHRSLVADAVIVRGAEVEDIIDPGTPHPHRLTPFAHVEGTRITYPGEGPGPERSSRSRAAAPTTAPDGGT